MGRIENLHIYPNTTSKEALMDSLARPIEAENGSIFTLCCELVRDYVFWCVHRVEWRPKTEPSVTWIASYTLHQVGDGDWGFTAEPELAFPSSLSCPMEFLKLAPVVNEEWRKQVYQYHADEILEELLRNGNKPN